MKSISQEELEAKRLEAVLVKHIKYSVEYDVEYLQHTITLVDKKLTVDFSKEEIKDLKTIRSFLVNRLNDLNNRS